ncbi:HlyD family type I secretion periplasmic adaptor subunit [Luminiphilus sp.]|nr:HlyD family type I secretion periplasmic adaptor subunit [Luminiphilus sp.]
MQSSSWSKLRAALGAGTPNAQITGYSIIGALFVVILIWGGLAPLESAALAPGVVEVEGKRKAVQHLEGGIIDSILVRNGDFVAKNQVLLQMDTTQAGAELQIVESRRFNLMAEVSRLSAERDDLESIGFLELLQMAAGNDQRADDAIAGEVTLFNARRLSRLGEAEVLGQRTAQLREKIAGLEAVRASKEAVAISLKEEISDLNELLAEGYVDKHRLRELQRLRSSVLGDAADLTAQIATTNVAIGETKLQIIQLTKQFKTEVVNAYKEAIASLYDIEQQYTAGRDRVERAKITAPEAGYVLGLVKTTVGAVVAPGEQLMEVVPSVDSMMVEAQVSPMDIDRVQIGQEAEIRFGVFKDAYSITGQLTRLSPDRLIDRETGIPYYSAEITISDMELLMGENMELVPGMPAEVLIKTGERTMLGYISSPLKRLFSRALIED